MGISKEAQKQLISMQILYELRICVLIFSGKMCDIYNYRKFWVYTNLMLIIQNWSLNEELSFLELSKICLD